MAIGLLAALAVGGWWLRRDQPVENAHPNWNQVAAAAEASNSQGTNRVIQRNSSGATREVPSVGVSLADADLVTTRAVREFLVKNDLAGANAALRAAQRLPARSLTRNDEPAATPVLGPNAKLLTAIREGSARFFHLNLLDCCDEDGDIVDISLNGEPFATVPLTHQGAIISVPLTPGITVITLRGVYDGGGGITVLFQTSQGDFFCQPMNVGEEYQVGVVVK